MSYHLYALGNALADMTFEVPFSFLEENKLEKGIMQLIDQNKQSELLNKLKDIPCKTLGGGSAANSVVAMAQFGGDAFFSCKVADDREGDLFINDLNKLGVKTSPRLGEATLPTGKCLVLVTPDADRTMLTYLGITERFSTEQLVEEVIKDAQYTYMEGYLLTSASARQALFKAQELCQAAGKKVALSFSDPLLVNSCWDDLNLLVERGVDLLFCNESEAVNFTKASSYEEAVQVLKGKVKSFAITLGDKGAIVFDGANEYFIAGRQVRAVDVNGSGDLFAGAFLYAITHHLDFAQAGRLACDAAALLVTQYGARLLTSQAQYILDAFQQKNSKEE